MQYLFQVAIGPVQGFIASARRSRDLWFGSHLLSEMSKIAAHTIAHQYSLDNLIFPHPASLQDLEIGSPLNVANKIVASIPISGGSEEKIGEELSSLGNAIRKKIDRRIVAIKEQVYQDIARGKEGDNSLFNKVVADAQIANLVEISWAAVPFDEGQYNQARKKLELLMAARKNTRNFSKVAWGGTAHKSSIDGQLESVINPDLYPKRKEDTAQQFNKARRLYNLFHAGPAEQLSGVDLLKRLGHFWIETSEGKRIQFTQDTFLSTSHIAAIPYLECLQRLHDQNNSSYDHAKNILQEYIKAVRSVLDDKLDRVPNNYENYAILQSYDGALFYPERHLDKLMKDASLAKAQEHLNNFFKEVKKALAENVEPSPYYAIICADGDHMGELIDTLANEKDGQEKHQALSSALDGFSRKTKEIVEKHKGALIYAGGDDVLAFLPLDKALECAKTLADTFSKDLQSFIEELTEDKEGKKPKKPSLSVGIAVVHHLTMLQEALNLAHLAEHKAKAVKEKNALAITINKRSGEQYSVSDKWESLYPILQPTLIDYFRRDYLPKGLPYELRDMAQRLTVIDAPKDDLIDEQSIKEKEQIGTLKTIMYQETKRILLRKLNLPQSRLAGTASAEERQKQDEWRKQQAKQILDTLLARIEGAPSPKDEASASNLASPATEPATDKKRVSIAEFINELIVAQEFAAAQTLAEGKTQRERPTEETREGNHQ